LGSKFNSEPARVTEIEERGQKEQEGEQGQQGQKGRGEREEEQGGPAFSSPQKPIPAKMAKIK
jgi:hypothetical protein